MIESGGWKRTCARCRVDRHDRCVGPGDCGCTDPSHEARGASEDAEIRTGFFAVADDPEPGGVYHLDSDDETVIVEMGTRQYTQLLAAAQAQERDPGVVLRRALDCYLHCPRADCRHRHDEGPEDATGAGPGEREAPAPDPPQAPVEADPTMIMDHSRT